MQQTVPPGIHCPRTFLEVGKELHRLLVIDIEHGFNPYLAQFKNKPATFNKAYWEQFTAYVQGHYPFAILLGPGQTPLHWWSAFENTANGGILAVRLNLLICTSYKLNIGNKCIQAIAIKLFSAVPHSMADKCTMSYITMLNTAQRSRQKVDTVVVMTQVAGYAKANELKKVSTIFKRFFKYTD